MTGDRWDAPPSAPVIVPAVAVSVLGAATLAVGGWLDPARALAAYLAAYASVLGIVLGALCLVMIAHTTGAGWIVVLRRLAENVAATAPIYVVLFVPIAAGMRVLYPWVPPLDALSADVRASVAAKTAYLNVPFFLVRAAVYLGTWWLLAWALRRWSLRQDRDPGSASLARITALSGLGLVLFAFTLTFAAFDWLMSLAPAWHSTAFGVYVFAGGMVAALALLVVLTRAYERAGVLAGTVAASHYHALGRLLLTFVVFWAYIAYAQGFLIWIADVPREATWYLARWGGGWKWPLAILVGGHFALPFLVLLSRRAKRSGAVMTWLAVWLLAMHYVDVAWVVLPALDRRVPLPWLELAALATVGGVTLAFGAWRSSGHLLVPAGDPRLAAALGYESR
jgi:hypothetical protein